MSARNVVITGAAGGIGSALLDRFLSVGDSVLAVDIEVKRLEGRFGVLRPAGLKILQADTATENGCAG